MARKGVLFFMLAAAVLGLCGIANAQKTITLGIYQEPENLNTYIGVHKDNLGVAPLPMQKKQASGVGGGNLKALVVFIYMAYAANVTLRGNPYILQLEWSNARFTANGNASGSGTSCGW